jgi:hypothetical protein
MSKFEVLLVFAMSHGGIEETVPFLMVLVIVSLEVFVVIVQYAPYSISDFFAS